MTLMMTSAQVVETSDTTTDNSPSQDYTHPDDLLQMIACHDKNSFIPTNHLQNLVLRYFV